MAKLFEKTRTHENLQCIQGHRSHIVWDNEFGSLKTTVACIDKACNTAAPRTAFSSFIKKTTIESAKVKAG